MTQTSAQLMKTLTVDLSPAGDIYELLNLSQKILQLQTDVKHVEIENKSPC